MGLFENMYFKRAVFAFQAMSMATFMIMVYNVELISMKYIIFICVILMGLFVFECYIVFRKTEKKVIGVITQVVSIALSIIMCICACDVNKRGKNVDLLTDVSFQEKIILVVD